MPVLNDIHDSEIQQFHEINGNELICEIRKTPTVLYGIFVELVRQFYSHNGPDDRLFGSPDVIWTPDPNTTSIWIDTEMRWEAEHTEFRPAIYVKLGQIQYSSPTGSKDGLIFSDVQEAVKHYARSGDGSVTFAHVGSTAGEACSLADATMDYLDAFSPVIRDDFCFDWFALASRSPVGPAQKDSKEKYVSTVTYTFRFTDEWTLKRESPKLKRVVVRATDAVSRRLRVGEYWDFDPATGHNRSKQPC